MSTDEVTSAAQKVKGSVKEAIGKLTGDKTTEREGAAQKGLPTEDAAASSAETSSNLSTKP